MLPRERPVYENQTKRKTEAQIKKGIEESECEGERKDSIDKLNSLGAPTDQAVVYSRTSIK